MNKDLLQIVQLLEDHEYHDDTSIGNQLNITSEAIWAAVKTLIDYDVAIKWVKGKGYILEKPFILLNEEKIKKQLNDPAIQLEILEKTDSTNDYAKKYLNQDKKPLVCLAETQTAGKGRMNRHWHSPFGQNIYFTLLYPYQKGISELSGLSLVVGLAACQAIELCCQLPDPLLVKWPNDIIANNQKMAGILIETQAKSQAACTLVIGIGININMKKAGELKISQPWTSLHQLSHQYHDRNELVASLIEQLLTYLQQFNLYGLSSFKEEWKKRDYLVNKRVKLVSNKSESTGIGAGINEQGQLLLNLENNHQEAFSSGDITLLK